MNHLKRNRININHKKERRITYGIHSIEVYLSDFDTDDIVEYLESEGYSVTKATEKCNSFELEKYIDIDRCQEMLNNIVTAKDFLTDILGLLHVATEEEIIERVKQIINQ